MRLAFAIRKVERLDLKALLDFRSQTSVLRSTRSTFNCIFPAQAARLNCSLARGVFRLVEPVLTSR
jgi:hypothetical protein